MFGTFLTFFCLVPIFLLLLVAWWIGVYRSRDRRGLAPWLAWALALLPMIVIGGLVAPYWVLTEGLIAAARTGDVAGVRWRLALGADPNGGNADGFSPLEEAVSLGRIETAQLLLQRGANPDLRLFDEDDNARPTARQSALEGRDKAMIELLSQYPMR